MIEIIGEPGNPEHDAAVLIQEAFVRSWPGIEKSSSDEDHIKIVSRAKISGQKVSDIDVVVVGRLTTKRYVVPRTNTKDTDGRSLVGTKIRVRSFVIAVEVKDHSSTGLVIEAGGVRVRYKGGWKSATDQNEDQRYGLVNYLKDSTGANPWVYRCLILAGVHELPKSRGIPHPEAGAVPRNFDAGSFLLAAAAVNGIKKLGHEHGISSGDEPTIDAILEGDYLSPLVPSNLDRKRMDRIAARPKEAKEISALLGMKRVHLRGNGGTGKTVLLLQSAYDAFLDRGIRSLVLTYNTALAADIQRTLALMGIPSDGDAGGITVRTVMSYLFSWLAKLGLLEEGVVVEDYRKKCAEALRYIQEGAITAEEINATKAGGLRDFDFDAILVDEAQDWPQEEADLLAQLHGPSAVSLADGVAQLVRGSATNWRSPVQGEVAVELRTLRDGLRMKSNLCRFANALAEEVGFQWHVTPNKAAPGGRIIVAVGEYANMTELQREVLAGALTDGNMPVDLLHCVPHSGVSEEGRRRYSGLARAFQRNSWETWDAVDEATRRTFPRSTSSLRVVQYESCRGLEGWCTVLDGLDEFWVSKRDVALVDIQGTDEAPADSKLYAEAAAWRWCMIPLTRPLDTLVIVVRSRASPIYQAILKVASQMPDVVELGELQ